MLFEVFYDMEVSVEVLVRCVHVCSKYSSAGMTFASSVDTSMAGSKRTFAVMLCEPETGVGVFYRGRFNMSTSVIRKSGCDWPSFPLPFQKYKTVVI